MAARPLTVRLDAAIADYGRSLSPRMKRTRREALRKRALRLLSSSIGGRDRAALASALQGEGLSRDGAVLIAHGVMTLAIGTVTPEVRYAHYQALARTLPEAVTLVREAAAGADAGDGPGPLWSTRADIGG